MFIMSLLGQKDKTLGKGCNDRKVTGTNLIACEFGDLSSRKNIILVGDSHA